ncbi:MULTISPECIES: helix-turn-helix transcriptional regulator [Paenibacillus]|jgi:predicted ArsR family transcriptional regulator|uniref:helix-turn-helix transcriptional regulator n=1 Tax=Paenibacillus TaxID=44249 RepID=UPI00048E0463|nr:MULTISPECIES: metalloregulator ArsR/SmtB family transcription factor [Paenibacillus]MEC2344130.1 transcriptional regulator [Paenibacillus barengoltzii]SMF44968.1 Predicted transcriptional regulator, ArsR family [Paenibacillus barengoltzii]
MNTKKDLSTRERILHLMKTAGPLSAKELTTELQITEMAVRRHLGTMERDGLIESKMVRQTAGRPTAVYGLTELAEGLFPKRYHSLTLDLLDELAEESGEVMVDRLFDRRKEKLSRKYMTEMQGKSLTEKVRTLSEIQNDNGYMTELQETDGGEYVLMEHNCPISQIANRYNHACDCELKLFESLLDADVERTECLAQQGRKCVYVIRQREQ